ncbi:MAG: MFS transporter [Acidilobus sp.]
MEQEPAIFLRTVVGTLNCERLGARHRSRLPWTTFMATFVALSLGMLVYGLAESYGPVYVASGVLSQSNAWLGYSITFIAGGFGALVAGYLTDSLGRKKAFILTAAMVVAGLALYLPHAFGLTSGPLDLGLLITSLVLVGMAAIGLETPILSMIAETSEAKERGKYLVIAQNFGNIGVALAYIPLLIFGVTSARAQYIGYDIALILMFLGPLAGLVIAWIKAAESIPWSAIREGRDPQSAWRFVDSSAEVVTPTTGLGLRLFTLITLGVVQDVGFVYFLYEAPSLFSSTGSASFSVIAPLIGGFAMAIVGIIIGLTVTGKVNRKEFTFISFGLMAALWSVLLLVGALTGFTASTPVIVTYILLMIPTELTWAARALLEPELFPTKTRGLYISMVRASVWIATGIITGVLSLGYVSGLGAVAAVTAVMLLGLGSSTLWYMRGFETGRKSLLGLDIHATGIIPHGAVASEQANT